MAKKGQAAATSHSQERNSHLGSASRSIDALHATETGLPSLIGDITIEYTAALEQRNKIEAIIQADKKLWGYSHFTYDENAAGGYPYGMLELASPQEIILPGLLGQDAFTDGGFSRRSKWCSDVNKDGADGVRVRVGMLNDVYYILDPTTKQAISPAFTEMVELTNDHAILRIPNPNGELYELRGVTGINDFFKVTTKKADEQTPDFLNRQLLSLRQVVTTELATIDQSANNVVRIDDADMFDLEPHGIATAARASEVFTNAFTAIAQHALIDTELRKKLAQPDQTLEFPQVMLRNTALRLCYATTIDSETIRVVADDENGIELVKRNGTDVSIRPLNDDSLQVIDATQPEYAQGVDAVNTLVQEYFARLYEQGSQLSAERLQELRKNLGQKGFAGWNARRAMRKTYGTQRRSQ